MVPVSLLLSLLFLGTCHGFVIPSKQAPARILPLSSAPDDPLPQQRDMPPPPASTTAPPMKLTHDWAVGTVTPRSISYSNGQRQHVPQMSFWSHDPTQRPPGVGGSMQSQLPDLIPAAPMGKKVPIAHDWATGTRTQARAPLPMSGQPAQHATSHQRFFESSPAQQKVLLEQEEPVVGVSTPYANINQAAAAAAVETVPVNPKENLPVTPATQPATDDPQPIVATNPPPPLRRATPDQLTLDQPHSWATRTVTPRSRLPVSLQPRQQALSHQAFFEATPDQQDYLRAVTPRSPLPQAVHSGQATSHQEFFKQRSGMTLKQQALTSSRPHSPTSVDTMKASIKVTREMETVASAPPVEHAVEPQAVEQEQQ